MITHMGYLPDIGRWLLWAGGGLVLVILVWVFVVVARWKYGGRE